jgi:hypothetical protein
MPVAPSDGESNAPVGAAPVPAAIVRRLTVTDPDVLAAPVNASVMVPLDVPDVGNPPPPPRPPPLDVPANLTPMLSAPEPEPDDGVTVSHGWLLVTVQVTVPEPL